MDVHRPSRGAGRPPEKLQGSSASPSRAGALSGERVGRALGEWQAAEVRLARRYPQCAGLNPAQLEDLYQETVLALLHRPYTSEEHLRNALRFGLKNRALHVHRDERRRGEILAENGPAMLGAVTARKEQEAPELAALAQHDELIANEFMTELTTLEQKVFRLEADGLGYRAIAPMLGVSTNEARKAKRCAAGKRERFQLLYDTGRLCGYRSQTIQALKNGRAANEQLVQGAYAHLDACAHCRAEHRTNAGRLRRSFQEKAAALLPLPVLSGHIGWAAKLEARLRGLTHRMAPYSSAPTSGGLRERTVAILAGGGASAKLAAGAATVAAIAGGAIGATRALEHPAAAHHTRVKAPAIAQGSGSSPPASSAVSAQARTSGAGGAPPHPETQAVAVRANSRPGEPSGFAYLGVPSGGEAHPAAAARASTAALSANATAASGGSEQRGGGPFSP